MLNHSSEQTTEGNSQPVFVQQKKAQSKDMYMLYLSAVLYYSIQTSSGWYVKTQNPNIGSIIKVK